MPYLLYFERLLVFITLNLYCVDKEEKISIKEGGGHSKWFMGGKDGKGLERRYDKPYFWIRPCFGDMGNVVIGDSQDWKKLT